ncbi:unnamed protein product [Cylicostephanus goldi]|uniref:Uncharacterized protein n=1 Tax=Cylicostephanus goldi TaxID=71465 RepID=A0A3P6QTE8_CYLGO|nr:unnamed protein product [Cylicostephanus goldi]
MLSVKISRFYRPEDVPEISLSLIAQERMEMDFAEEPTPEALSRELFTSDTTTFHSIASLSCFSRDIAKLSSFHFCSFSDEMASLLCERSLHFFSFSHSTHELPFTRIRTLFLRPISISGECLKIMGAHIP